VSQIRFRTARNAETGFCLSVHNNSPRNRSNSLARATNWNSGRKSEAVFGVVLDAIGRFARLPPSAKKFLSLISKSHQSKEDQTPFCPPNLLIGSDRTCQVGTHWHCSKLTTKLHNAVAAVLDCIRYCFLLHENERESGYPHTRVKPTKIHT